MQKKNGIAFLCNYIGRAFSAEYYFENNADGATMAEVRDHLNKNGVVNTYEKTGVPKNKDIVHAVIFVLYLYFSFI